MKKYGNKEMLYKDFVFKSIVVNFICWLFLSMMNMNIYW